MPWPESPLPLRPQLSWIPPLLFRSFRNVHEVDCGMPFPLWRGVSQPPRLARGLRLPRPPRLAPRGKTCGFCQVLVATEARQGRGVGRECGEGGGRGMLRSRDHAQAAKSYLNCESYCQAGCHQKVGRPLLPAPESDLLSCQAQGELHSFARLFPCVLRNERRLFVL